MSRFLSRLTAAIGVSGVLLAGFVFYWAQPVGQGGAGPGPGGRGGQVPLVRAERVALVTFVEALEALGTARANESITVTAQTTDTVAKIHFTDGQVVEQGAILVELTSAEEDADLRAARAALSEAEKQLARLEELAKSGSAAQSRLDQQRGVRDAAKGRVDAIEARLADRLIRATFSGVLGLRNVSPGTLVRPGDVITTLDDISRVKVDFTVPEIFLASLAPGQDITAESAAFPGETFAGKVTSIDSRVDPVTRAVIVRAEVPNPDQRLRPGMLMSVVLVKSQREAPAVEEGAIVPVATEQFVFVLDAELSARRVKVATGARKPGFVEITDGLALGDLVVVEGTNKVRDGMKVKLPKPPEGPGGVAGGAKGGA